MADIQRLFNPIYNHLHEQIVRAVLYPDDLNVMLSSTLQRPMQMYVQPFDMVKVGYVDYKADSGWTLHPTTNSMLIRLGIKPTAFLYSMNSLEIEGVPVLFEDAKGDLMIPIVGLLEVARLFCDNAELHNKVFEYQPHYAITKRLAALTTKLKSKRG